MPRVRAAVYREAASIAFGGVEATPWEQRLVRRRTAIRTLYGEQAKLLLASRNPDDRRLGQAVLQFLKDMPAPDTQRLALARELRAANARLQVRDAHDRGR